jgi:hypothetical protein
MPSWCELGLVMQATKKNGCAYMFCSDISNSNIDGYYNSEYPSGTSVQQRYISVLLTEMRPDILGKDKTHPQISGTIWHCSFFLHIAV